MQQHKESEESYNLLSNDGLVEEISRPVRKIVVQSLAESYQQFKKLDSMLPCLALSTKGKVEGKWRGKREQGKDWGAIPYLWAVAIERGCPLFQGQGKLIFSLPHYVVVQEKKFY